MAASKKIVETHYGRNIGFTRAVDELNIIRNGAMARIREEIRCPMPDIVLKRLTEQQIDDARNGNLSHCNEIPHGVSRHEAQPRTTNRHAPRKKWIKKCMRTERKRTRKCRSSKDITFERDDLFFDSNTQI